MCHLPWTIKDWWDVFVCPKLSLFCFKCFKALGRKEPSRVYHPIYVILENLPSSISLNKIKPSFFLMLLLKKKLLFDFYKN